MSLMRGIGLNSTDLVCHFETFITDLHDADGQKIERAPKPMELLTITVPQEVKAGDMIRACKEGLVNLYKEDGSSLTVRT